MVEQRPFKSLVVGSNPTGTTNFGVGLRRFNSVVALDGIHKTIHGWRRSTWSLMRFKSSHATNFLDFFYFWFILIAQWNPNTASRYTPKYILNGILFLMDVLIIKKRLLLKQLSLVRHGVNTVTRFVWLKYMRKLFDFRASRNVSSDISLTFYLSITILILVLLIMPS